MVANPWRHVDFEPLDMAVRALVLEAVARSGGTDDEDEIHAALTDWFRAQIPDLLGDPAREERAIRRQAKFLFHAEGSALWGCVDDG